MGKSRTVKTHFWNDTFVGGLEPEDKLLFLYLITNPLTNMLGVYEIQLRRICFDTKLPEERVTEGLETLRKAKKADYVDGYIILSNFVKNQNYNTNMLKSAAADMGDLPDSVLRSPFFETIMEWFRRVPERYEMVRNIEVEIEREVEVECEESVSPGGHDFPDSCEHLEEAEELAWYLLDAITEATPSHRYKKNPPSMRDWILEIERAIRLDGRTPEQLQLMIDFIFTQQNEVSDFWRPNIESGKKLRQKFDKIVGQARREMRKQNGQYTTSRADKFKEKLF